MDVSKLDKNFITHNANFDEYDWYDATDKPFELFGVYFDEKEKIFTRMPKKEREKVSAHVNVLATYTSGGRLRFRTDSPYIAVQSTQPCALNPNKGSLITFCGFSFYANNLFCNTTMPASNAIYPEGEKEFFYDGVIHVRHDIASSGNVYDGELVFPLYNGVNGLKIGIKKGYKVLPPKKYSYTKPVVFYGSSITQGGCASRPGIDYVNRISRMLDVDIVNLGFSGNAKGEKEMAEYISKIDASVFVMDYDYNAPTVEHLQQTHEPFYKIVREKNPNLPIIFVSRPNTDHDASAKERLEVIEKTYFNAKSRGEKVELINGATLFQGEGREDCTVDGVHPNDVGFERMAKVIAPVISKYLN